MRLILTLVLLGLLSFFFGLGSVGLIGPDESRYAQVARGMLERADWITPHLQGEPWLDKPPLYYWAAAVSMRLLGETETAARFPAAIAAIATCFAIAFVGTRWFGFAAGLRSALVLAASLGMVLYGRAAIMDSLLTLALTIGLGAYALYVMERPSLSWLVTALAAIGAGVLAKGPLAVVLSLLIIIPFHLLDRVGPRSRSPRLTVPTATHAIVSVASFLVVVIPWHAAILQRMGWEFVEVFFLQHNVDRFLTTVHRHPGPIYYYLPVLAVALFPWSAFVPAAIARAMRGIEARRTFLLLWIVSPLVFFSLSGAKLPGYLLPVLPPFALLIGLLWAPAAESGKEETAVWLNRSLAFHVAWCLVLGAAALLGFHGRLPEMVTASRWLAVLLVGLGAGAYVAGRRRPGAAFWSLTASSVSLTLLMVLYLGPMVEPHQSLKALATKGFSELKPGERVICYKAFYPRAHFYTRDRLGAIWTLEEFRTRAAEWGRIVALTEPDHYREIAEDASLEARVIARSGNRLLVEARAALVARR
ncbi:MAG: ArnT family glycosyltransferase [Vicinamibacteria bacterium]